MEEDLIIFMHGRGPSHTWLRVSDSLFDSLRDQCVMTTSARCNLVIIASME